MISNQIGNKTIYVSRGSPNNNTETVERETEKKVLDTEIQKKDIHPQTTDSGIIIS